MGGQRQITDAQRAALVALVLDGCPVSEVVEQAEAGVIPGLAPFRVSESTVRNYVQAAQREAGSDHEWLTNFRTRALAMVERERERFEEEVGDGPMSDEQLEHLRKLGAVADSLTGVGRRRVRQVPPGPDSGLSPSMERLRRLLPESAGTNGTT